MTFTIAERLALGCLRRLTHGSVADIAVPPVGAPVELPGRGTTYVVDLPGPTPEAPTLLLTHGIATTGPLTWFAVLEDLSAHYRVVTFDQRWHGRGIASPTFSLADCADDSVAVLDALGIDRAVVVGYSMGGVIAQEMWHRHPERIAGLVLCSTAARWQGHLAERAFYGVLGISNLAVGALAASRVRAHAAALLPPSEAEDLEAWGLRELLATSPWSLSVVVSAIGRFDSRDWISDVTVPTGVLLTERDLAVPIARQRELAAAIPGAVARETPGGHTSLAFDLERWKPAFLELVGEVVTEARSAA